MLLSILSSDVIFWGLYITVGQVTRDSVSTLKNVSPDCRGEQLTMDEGGGWGRVSHTAGYASVECWARDNLICMFYVEGWEDRMSSSLQLQCVMPLHFETDPFLLHHFHLCLCNHDYGHCIHANWKWASYASRTNRSSIDKNSEQEMCGAVKVSWFWTLDAQTYNNYNNNNKHYLVMKPYSLRHCVISLRSWLHTQLDLPGGCPMSLDLAPIGVFWDIENCAVPHGKSALALVQRIRDQFFHGHKEVEFLCACDISRENRYVIQDLNYAQVECAISDTKFRQGLSQQYIPALIAAILDFCELVYCRSRSSTSLPSVKTPLMTNCARAFGALPMPMNPLLQWSFSQVRHLANWGKVVIASSCLALSALETRFKDMVFQRTSYLLK